MSDVIFNARTQARPSLQKKLILHVGAFSVGSNNSVYIGDFVVRKNDGTTQEYPADVLQRIVAMMDEYATSIGGKRDFQPRSPFLRVTQATNAGRSLTTVPFLKSIVDLAVGNGLQLNRPEVIDEATQAPVNQDGNLPF